MFRPIFISATISPVPWMQQGDGQQGDGYQAQGVIVNSFTSFYLSHTTFPLRSHRFVMNRIGNPQAIRPKGLAQPKFPCLIFQTDMKSPSHRERHPQGSVCRLQVTGPLQRSLRGRKQQQAGLGEITQLGLCLALLLSSGQEAFFFMLLSVLRNESEFRVQTFGYNTHSHTLSPVDK